MRAIKQSRGANQEKIYLLNEGQAMFLMTLLRNDGVDGVVVRFKARLASEFIRMRNFIREKQSKLWNDTRLSSKEHRPLYFGEAVFLSGLEVCACCPVADIWCKAAGQGLIVCRTWGFADNQSGQFPKAGNS